MDQHQRSTRAARPPMFLRLGFEHLASPRRQELAARYAAMLAGAGAGGILAAYAVAALAELHRLEGVAK